MLASRLVVLPRVVGLWPRLCDSRRNGVSSSVYISNSNSSSILNVHQKSCMDFHKLLANAKRNLKICSQRVSKATFEEGAGYVKLEELLVEKKLTEMCGASGVPIYPPSHLIFNALNSTHFHAVKAIILGQKLHLNIGWLLSYIAYFQDPYHGPSQAMGLSFLVPEGVKVPSSLPNIFKELKQDLGCSIPSHGNLEKWVVQGVLLLNIVLTDYALSFSWNYYSSSILKKKSKKEKLMTMLDMMRSMLSDSSLPKSPLLNDGVSSILSQTSPLSYNFGFVVSTTDHLPPKTIFFRTSKACNKLLVKKSFSPPLKQASMILVSPLRPYLT
ncbi:hypothetical protein UlMin_033052 [Ulmus minor]